MGSSTFSGPVRVGSAPAIGTTLLSQVIPLVRDATLVQNGTIYLPANAQIVDILADATIAWDSATTATLSVGISSGAQTYANGVNMKTANRARPTFTAAQLIAMNDIGATNLAVVATVTSVGQPTVGAGRVTVLYTLPGPA